eukprot:151032-Rhodomonas_salina.1
MTKSLLPPAPPPLYNVLQHQGQPLAAAAGSARDRTPAVYGFRPKPAHSPPDSAGTRNNSARPPSPKPFDLALILRAAARLPPSLSRPSSLPPSSAPLPPGRTRSQPPTRHHTPPLPPTLPPPRRPPSSPSQPLPPLLLSSHPRASLRLSGSA